MTVSGVTLDQGSGQTLAVAYGDTTGGGPGATATSTTGVATWTTQERSSSRGTLTSLAAAGQPKVQVYAADGSGTVAMLFVTASASQSGLSERLTFSTPAGGLTNGILQVDVPAGWTPPSTVAGPGYTTSNFGVVSVSGQRITVTGVTRTVQGQTVIVTYGSGGTATAPATTGTQTWQFGEASTAGGVITPIAAQPSVTLYAPDGGGAATTSTTNVSASQTGNTVTFTYTAATGGMSAGGVKLTIPAGWTAPSTTANNAGYTTSSTGTLTIAARVVTVANVTLAAGSTFTITFGDTSGGGAGATATATTGAQTWLVQDKATTRRHLHEQRLVAVDHGQRRQRLGHARRVDLRNVSASQTGRTITFTYTAAAGDMVNGAVTVTAPAGWSAPSTTATDPGYTTASTGVVSAAGQTVTVSGVSLDRRLDDDDRLRRHGRRRPRRDRGLDDGCADVAGTGAVHARRRAREPRCVTCHHRLRRGRLRHGRRVDLRRLRGPDRPRRHAHLHARDRRDAERIGDRRRAVGLDAAVDVGRSGLLDGERRRADRLGPDDHRHRGDAHRWRRRS